MFPYPSGAGLARRPSRGLHRHRHHRALQAAARLQRAAPDGLGRVRPARPSNTRSRPGSIRPSPRARTSRNSSRSSNASAFPTTGSARSTRPIPATTDGRSGFSSSSTIRGSIRRRKRRSRSPPIAAMIPTACASPMWPKSPVNWCPELGTVLANEEVIDGKSEVGGFPVVRRPMRQWMLRITAYAERLLDELEGLDWPESIKALQRNWIGRSEGAEIEFPVAGRIAGRRGTSDHRLHHAARHALRRDLHGARARASAGRSDHDAKSSAKRSQTYRDEIAAKVRSRTHRLAKEKTGVVHRRLRDQSGQRRTHPDLDRRLRADGLRHRRDHGRAGARRARLEFARKVRSADCARSSRRRGRRRRNRSATPATASRSIRR